MSSNSTVSTISLQNICFASLMSSDVQMILVEPVVLQNPFFLTMTMPMVLTVLGPPWSTILVLSITFTMPLAAALTIVVLIGHPLSLNFNNLYIAVLHYLRLCQGAVVYLIFWEHSSLCPTVLSYIFNQQLL